MTVIINNHFSVLRSHGERSKPETSICKKQHAQQHRADYSCSCFLRKGKIVKLNMMLASAMFLQNQKTYPPQWTPEDVRIRTALTTNMRFQTVEVQGIGVHRGSSRTDPQVSEALGSICVQTIGVNRGPGHSQQSILLSLHTKLVS